MADSRMFPQASPGFVPSIPLNRCKDIAWECSAKLVVNADGVVVVANRQAESIFGYISGGLVGEKLVDLIPVINLQSVIAGATNFQISGHSLQGKRRDGQTLPVIAALTPFKEEGVLYVMADIDVLDQSHAS